MIYLLDVNVLVGLGYETHSLHIRSKSWIADAYGMAGGVQFATCSVTEMGFVRVATGKDTQLSPDVPSARRDLARLKKHWSIVLLNDSLGADYLPIWAHKPEHVTDGHLLALAKYHNAELATLDRGIRGAILLPELLAGSNRVQEPYSQYGSN